MFSASRPTKDGSQDRVALDYSTLEERAFLSRAVIRRALDKLSELIEVRQGTGRTTNVYVIRNFPKAGEGWAKLPAGYITEGKKLRLFSLRSGTDLAALKLYLLLLAFRDNRSNESRISYEKIGDYTNLTRTNISRARSKLIEADLITLYSGRDSGENRDHQQESYNRYHIRGLQVQ